MAVDSLAQMSCQSQSHVPTGTAVVPFEPANWPSCSPAKLNFAFLSGSSGDHLSLISMHAAAQTFLLLLDAAAGFE